MQGVHDSGNAQSIHGFYADMDGSFPAMNSDRQRYWNMTIEDHGNRRSIEVEGRSQYVLNPFDPQSFM